MIEKIGDYEQVCNDLRQKDQDNMITQGKQLIETIEALRKVARAAKSAQRMWQEEYGAANVVLQRALNAIPDWIKE